MMTDWELEKLTARAAELAAGSAAKTVDSRAKLGPLFREALRLHPDDEVRLLALWDEITARQLV
jgi:hypothetical protein